MSESQELAVVPMGGVGPLVFAVDGSRDRTMAAALRRGEEWEPFHTLVFKRVVRPGMLVCDATAGVGWYSVIAARRGAQVIAIESDSHTYELLRRNLEANNCALVTTTINDALDGRDHPLDDHLSDSGIAVLRIDGSGAESAILDGAAQTLGRGVTALFVMICPRGLRERGSSTHDLLIRLGGLGLEAFEIDEYAQVLWPLGPDELRERTSAGRHGEVGGECVDLILLAPKTVDSVRDLIRVWPVGRALADHLHPDQRRRVEHTVSCNDTASIEKVPDAGAVVSIGGHLVQVMHNGVRVQAGGYYGDWMMEIITRLRGHHEPQEERVFHGLVGRLAEADTPGLTPVIVELGAFWSYYSLWFMSAVKNSRAVLVEPDPDHLSVARTNLALNDCDAMVIQAAIGKHLDEIEFHCEGGSVVRIPQLCLREILDAADVARADLVACDIQGAETDTLEEACGYLASRVRFLVLSTHHESISDHPDTHQRCVAIVRQCGGHIIAEHTVDESYSGDGLLVASFDPIDRDLHIDVSLSRVGDSLFGETPCKSSSVTEHVANLEKTAATAIEYARSLEAHRLRLEMSLVEATAYAQSLKHELDRLHTD